MVCHSLFWSLQRHARYQIGLMVIAGCEDYMVTVTNHHLSTQGSIPDSRLLTVYNHRPTSGQGSLQPVYFDAYIK